MVQLAELEQLVQLGKLVRPCPAAGGPVAVAGAVGAGRAVALPLALLVLQPTPFCNLDCRYCYLPNRDSRARMSLTTLEAALQRVVEAGVLGDELSIVWHAGEPLVVPRVWYEQAFAAVQTIVPAGVRVEHHFQTNATLVDPSWCRFVREHGVRVGVSLDGPAFLHDAARHNRRGEGTHARAMQGVDRLQQAGIPVHAICVLGRASLDHPDAIWDFFIGAGIREVGFNIEERDGINQVSTLNSEADVVVFARFMARILDRYREDPDRLRVREIDRVVEALLDPAFDTYRGNAQNQTFGMLSVAWDGGIATFSPELLGTAHPAYGTFAFGNVHTHSLADVARDSRLRRISREILRGVVTCRADCPYFAFCRGGAPANKLAEHGRFSGTSTLFCQMTQMVVVETVLRGLEADLDAIERRRAEPVTA
jgi:uncharacterized protein